LAISLFRRTNCFDDHPNEVVRRVEHDCVSGAVDLMHFAVGMACASERVMMARM
jgi:hypothetical protein